MNNTPEKRRIKLKVCIRKPRFPNELHCSSLRGNLFVSFWNERIPLFINWDTFLEQFYKFSHSLWKKKSRSKLNTVAWRCCIWNNNCSFSRCIHFYSAPPFFHFHPQAFQFPCSNRFKSRRKPFNESKHFHWANSEICFLQLKSPIRFCLKFYDLDVRVQFFCCISSHLISWSISNHEFKKSFAMNCVEFFLVVVSYSTQFMKLSCGHLSIAR